MMCSLCVVPGADSGWLGGTAHISSPACSPRCQLAGLTSCSFLLWGLSASTSFGDLAVLEAQNEPPTPTPTSHWHWSQIQSGHWVSWLDGLVIVIGTGRGWIYGNELT